MDMEFLQKMAENILGNIKTIKDTVMDLTNTLMEINMLGNGQNINTMEKEYIPILMEVDISENGKKKKYNYPDDLTERHGTGTYIYINGDKYIGKWKDGLKHGKGIFIYHTGEIEKGIWKKDKLDKLK